jgi:hypothetical protein
MAVKAKAVKVERLIAMLRGDDQAIDVVFRLVKLLAKRPRRQRRSPPM